MRLFEVGGCVRDSILGVPTKDIDFAVEMTYAFLEQHKAEDAFLKMQLRLVEEGFTIFLSTPEHFTLRAKFPKGHKNERLVADFVMCRIDGPSSDGRHPDSVQIGLLEHDLARRDFTMNAIAIDSEHVIDIGFPVNAMHIIDPHGGVQDIADRIIRFVGDPMARLREDSLRALRGLRFSITKNMRLDEDAADAIYSRELTELFCSAVADGVLSMERIRDELVKMFQADTMASLDAILTMPLEFRDTVLGGRIWLKPTMEDR